MVTAVVLIKVETLMEKAVFTELQKIKEIREAHQILGMYDIFLKLETDDYEKLSRIVLEIIRKIPGVIDTKTLPEAQFTTM